VSTNALQLVSQDEVRIIHRWQQNTLNTDGTARISSHLTLIPTSSLPCCVVSCR